MFQGPASAVNGSVLSLSVSNGWYKTVYLSPGKQVENTPQGNGKTVCQNDAVVQSDYKGNNNENCRAQVSQTVNTVLHESQSLDNENIKEVCVLSSVLSKVLSYPKV